MMRRVLPTSRRSSSSCRGLSLASWPGRLLAASMSSGRPFVSATSCSSLQYKTKNNHVLEYHVEDRSGPVLLVPLGRLLMWDAQMGLCRTSSAFSRNLGHASCHSPVIFARLMWCSCGWVPLSFDDLHCTGMAFYAAIVEA